MGGAKVAGTLLGVKTSTKAWRHSCLGGLEQFLTKCKVKWRVKQGSRDFFMSTTTAGLLPDVIAASSRCQWRRARQANWRALGISVHCSSLLSPWGDMAGISEEIWPSRKIRYLRA